MELSLYEKGIEGLKIRIGPKPGITEESKEIILSVLFNDPYIFGHVLHCQYICLSVAVTSSFRRVLLSG
jgi:hypothetical protein